MDVETAFWLKGNLCELVQSARRFFMALLSRETLIRKGLDVPLHRSGKMIVLSVDGAHEATST